MRKPKWSRTTHSVVRTLIGLIALSYVVLRINRQEAVNVLARADLLLLGCAFALTALAMVGMTALRWQRLVLAQGTSVPIARLAVYYLVGYFFNMVLPGSIGGDVYRIVKLGDQAGSRSSALASVLSERLLGLAALLLIGVVGFAITQTRLAGQSQFVMILALFGLLLGCGVSALSFRRWFRLFRPVYERLVAFALLRRLRVQERAARLYDALSTYLQQPGVLLFAFLVSLVSRSLWVSAAFLTGRAIGIYLPFGAYMAALAITELVRMVPISLGGIGVREGAFVVLLSPFGVSSGSAFMLSFLFYLMLMLLGVMGGGVYVALGLRPRQSTTLQA